MIFIFGYKIMLPLLLKKHGNEVIARDCWSKAMILDPYNAYVCHALSNLEKRHRNYERARDLLESVVRASPTAVLCVSLAELEQQIGNPEQAKSVLHYGLQHCTRDRSKLLLSLAWLEEDLFNNLKEASILIDEALRIDRNNVKVYIAKASMDLRHSRIADARNTLCHALSLDSEDAQHYTMLSTIEYESGRIAEAFKILEDGSQKYPGDHFLLQRWGALEAKCGRKQKARELFEASVLIQPHAPTFVAWAILEDEVGVAVG